MDESIFNKAVGKGLIKIGSSISPPKIVSTGLRVLDDEILSIGGFPLGRIVELAGLPSGGKSSFAMNFVASAQKQGYRCLWVDLEGGSYDKKWAEGIGVDVDSLYVMDVEGYSGEEVLSKLGYIIAMYEPRFNFIIIDSIANIRSNLETDTILGEEKMNTDQSRAKLLTRFFRAMFGGWKITLDGKMAAISNSLSDSSGKEIYRLNEFDTSLILINHLKEKIGGYSNVPIYDSIGGVSFKFASTIRLFFKQLGKKDNNEDLLRIKIHCQKHKLGPPYKSGEFIFNSKTCKFEEDYEYLLKLLVDKGVFEKSGGWYSNNEIKFHGVLEFKKLCIENVNFYKDMLLKIDLKKIDDCTIEEEEVNE